MTIRGGRRPRDGRDQAHPLEPASQPSASADRPGRFEPPPEPRLGRVPGPTRRRRGSGDGRGGGALRFLVFAVVLGGFVLVALATVLRPLLADGVAAWAGDNPTLWGVPVVADLVKEDLGDAITRPASDDPSEVEFTVEPGDTVPVVRDRLVDQELLAEPRAFLFQAYQRDLASRLQAGTFLLRRNMSPDELVTGLLEARIVTVTLSLREGLRLEQITAYLQTRPLRMDMREFYELAKAPPPELLADYPWLAEVLPEGASLEGFLAPATYTVLPTITAEEFLRQLLDSWARQVGPDRLAVPDARGLTFYEVLTLASIVEREASRDDERALIAGVYQNRLDTRPRILNADPTVFYALDTLALDETPFDAWREFVFWKPPGRPLNQVELPESLAGYQTYNRAGLIPGPIATPSVASIEAALAPDTDDGFMYFVAIPGGDGRHDFSKTFEEHQQKLREYGYR